MNDNNITPAMKEVEGVKVGDKVTYEACHEETGQDMFGIGWVKEIDDKNNRIWIQTTRKFIWVETAGVTKIQK